MLILRFVGDSIYYYYFFFISVRLRRAIRKSIFSDETLEIFLSVEDACALKQWKKWNIIVWSSALKPKLFTVLIKILGGQWSEEIAERFRGLVTKAEVRVHDDDNERIES